MAEEQTTENSAEETEADGVSTADVRNHKFFISRMREKDAELKQAMNQLAVLQDKIESEQKAKQLQEEEAKGNYEKVLAQYKADLEKAKADHAAEIRRRDIQSALLKAGASDDFFIEGVIQRYDGEVPIETYVTTIAENEAHSKYFGQAQVDASNIPPGAVSPAQRSPQSWGQVQADLRSPDPTVRHEANRKVRDYMDKYQKEPPW